MTTTRYRTIADEGHALMTDDETLEMAESFDAAVAANAEYKLHPTSHDLGIHPKDAARQASFGCSVEHELSQVGPEPDDVCPACEGRGWIESDCREYAIECACQVVPS